MTNILLGKKTDNIFELQNKYQFLTNQSNEKITVCSLVIKPFVFM